MKALILDNVVVDLVETEFEVHSSMTWMDAPDGCKVGYIVQDGSIVDNDQRTNDQKQADLMAKIRSDRRKLLTASDWTQGPDSPLSDTDKASWATYRQALRDITDGSYTSEDDVTWPTPPS